MRSSRWLHLHASAARAYLLGEEAEPQPVPVPLPAAAAEEEVPAPRSAISGQGQRQKHVPAPAPNSGGGGKLAMGESRDREGVEVESPLPRQVNNAWPGCPGPRAAASSIASLHWCTGRKATPTASHREVGHQAQRSGYAVTGVASVVFCRWSQQRNCPIDARPGLTQRRKRTWWFP